jgi:hypothetical protein
MQTPILCGFCFDSEQNRLKITKKSEDFLKRRRELGSVFVYREDDGVLVGLA